MEEKKVDVDIAYLPPEIIRNILKRLPVKSLVRFHCVSKEWRNLFKTQSFIGDHLEHSNHQNPGLLFQCFDGSDLLNLYCLDSEMQVWEFPKPPLHDYRKPDKIVGSCNGLLCVQINDPHVAPHPLLVWNPSIREVRLVPAINFHQDYEDYNIGFGFSSIINDYKIVIACNSQCYTEISAVQVYSLIAGSWKEVKFCLNCTECLSDDSVTLNGVMFWLGSKRVGKDTDDDEVQIVSFDLANEVFTSIAIPKLHLWTTLTVYEEKLAIVSCMTKSELSVVDLWVMEEGVHASGEIWSWTKRYTSNPYPCWLYPQTIWRNEIVCTADIENKPTAVLVNPTTKRIKKHVISKCDCGPDILNYSESLVPVGGMKSLQVFCMASTHP
ncbi:hypothetical protein QN277_005727 [Acacia crassicarpa]|uniref:F-box domain-containing protein n=1 Tax=Acacia crassicarpa TaxID=499986 RepID=A0AAE1MBV6_9FABA|nr:hypothetical protein QN277_005727 [Acacia crassicarpa]